MYTETFYKFRGNIKYCAMLGIARLGIHECTKDIVLFASDSQEYYDIMYAGISLVLLKDKYGLSVLKKLVQNEIKGGYVKSGLKNAGVLKNIREKPEKANIGKASYSNRVEYILIIKFLKDILSYPRQVTYITDGEIDAFFTWCHDNDDRLEGIDQDRYFKRNPIYLYLPMIIGKCD